MNENKPASKPDKDKSLKNLWRFLQFSRPYWIWLAAATITGMLRMILPMYMPIFVKKVIDDVLLVEGLTLQQRFDTFWWMLVPLCLLLLVHAVSTLGRFYCPQVAATHAIRDVRYRLFAHLQRLSLVFHRQRPTGAIVSRVINDVNTAQNVFDLILVQFWQVIVQGTIIFGYLLYRDWQWALVCFATMPAFIVMTRMVSLPMRKASRLVLESFGRVSGRITERLSMIREVQAFTAEDHEEHHVRHEVNALARHSRRRALLSAILTGASEITRTVGLVVVLGFGVHRVLSGKATVGDVTAFYLYVGMLLWPMEFFSRLYSDMHVASAAADRVFDFLDTAPVIRDEDAAVPLQAGRPPEVCFEDVRFLYPTDSPVVVLDGITFTVSPGARVVLVGESGTGKSTLASLLPRFYDIQGGRILIDGQDIRNVTVQSLRRSIGIVPQEPVLFGGTIRENILYGRRDATEEEMRAAAVEANVDAFVAETPGGYDAIVGERGVGLSGGQIQRIALARAFLRNPPVLILDEATSNLDAHSEALILEAIDRLARGRTTFIIAHRLTVALRADIILVMENGKVAEMGKHAELLRAGGAYSRLWRRQMGGVPAEPAE